MLKNISTLILLLVVPFFLQSCASSKDEMEMLDSAIRAYERSFRWGEYSTAKSFHKNDAMLSDLERRRLQLYRITAYKVLQHTTPDPYNSILLIEIKYYRNDRPVVKSMTFRQHWRRLKDSKIWYVDSEFPRLR